MRNIKLRILSILLLILVIFVGIEVYEKQQETKEIEQNYQKRLAILKNLQKFDLENIKLERLKALDTLDVKFLEAGKLEMKQHKVVIAGIARDNLLDLPMTIKHINHIGSFFKDYRVVIFENDSKDGTKIAFDIWSQKDPRVKIISKDFMNKKRPNHKFMADVRNKYLEAIEEDVYKDFDMVMMLDMDMSYGVDVRGIQDSFSKIHNWDVVCANGIANSKGQMYDMFAFRDEEFPFSPLKWHQICSKDDANDVWTEKCKKGKDYSKGFLYDLVAFRGSWQEDARLFWLLILPQGQKIYPVGGDFIKASSCFGGMAFYKKDIIGICKYDSIDDDSEHIYFHQCLKEKNGAKIVMNPSQMMWYSQYK